LKKEEDQRRAASADRAQHERADQSAGKRIGICVNLNGKHHIPLPDLEVNRQTLNEHLAPGIAIHFSKFVPFGEMFHDTNFPLDIAKHLNSSYRGVS
jgi:hypothetical protein